MFSFAMENLKNKSKLIGLFYWYVIALLIQNQKMMTVLFTYQYQIVLLMIIKYGGSISINQRSTYAKNKIINSVLIYFFQCQCYMPINVINNAFKNNKAFYLLGSRMTVNECYFIDNLEKTGNDIQIAYNEINCYENHIIKLANVNKQCFFLNHWMIMLN